MDGTHYSCGQLRQDLLDISPGDSIAYSTDFLLSTAEQQNQLVRFLAGCRTLICGNNYHDRHEDLAKKNFHMASTGVAALAARVKPEEFVLFHLSDRYQVVDWLDQLSRVRSVIPNARFPAAWGLEEASLSAEAESSNLSPPDGDGQVLSDG